jgi:hypothetical protein
VSAQALRFVAWIDGNSRYTRARRLDRLVLVSVVRQLAEAERSPTTAIKEKHQRPMRYKI